MSEDQSFLPLPPQGADEVADAIKVYLLDKVLGAWRQPSPRELVAELDHEIGVVARWDLVSVVMSLSKDREVTTRAMRAYLKAPTRRRRPDQSPSRGARTGGRRDFDHRCPSSPKRPVSIVKGVQRYGGLHVALPRLRAVQPNARACPESGTSTAYISRHLDLDGTVPNSVSSDTIAKVAGKIERMALGLAKRPTPKVARAIAAGGEGDTSRGRAGRFLERSGSDA